MKLSLILENVDYFVSLYLTYLKRGEKAILKSHKQETPKQLGRNFELEIFIITSFFSRLAVASHIDVRGVTYIQATYMLVQLKIVCWGNDV